MGIIILPRTFMVVGKLKPPPNEHLSQCLLSGGTSQTTVACGFVLWGGLFQGLGILGSDICCLTTHLSDLGQLLIYPLDFIICKLHILLFSEYIILWERQKNLPCRQKILKDPHLGHYSEHWRPYQVIAVKPFGKWTPRASDTVNGDEQRKSDQNFV